jgi:hypothetical protein
MQLTLICVLRIISNLNDKLTLCNINAFPLWEPITFKTILAHDLLRVYWTSFREQFRNYSLLNIAVQWLLPLLRTRDVPGWIPNSETGCPDWFLDHSQFSKLGTRSHPPLFLLFASCCVSILIMVHTSIFAVYATIFLFTLHVSTLKGHHHVLFVTHHFLLNYNATFL